jgi:hypothetical protein
MIVKNISTDTVEINCNVRKSEQKVRCSSCGAAYTIEVYLDKKPTVSNELLAKLDNRVHP